MTRLFSQAMVAVLVSFAAMILSPAAASGAEAADPETKPDAEAKAVGSKVDVKADWSSFKQVDGNFHIEFKGNICVTQTEGESSLTVYCDHMTASMKDKKMDKVEATGNVVVVTGETHATAHKAELDLTGKTITLYGSDDAPVVLTSAEAPGMESSGPVFIYHTDTQSGEWPKGSNITVPTDSLSSDKDAEKKAKP